jgi:hypothetical protein
MKSVCQLFRLLQFDPPNCFAQISAVLSPAKYNFQDLIRLSCSTVVCTDIKFKRDLDFGKESADSWHVVGQDETVGNRNQ